MIKVPRKQPFIIRIMHVKRVMNPVITIYQAEGFKPVKTPIIGLYSNTNKVRKVPKGYNYYVLKEIVTIKQIRRKSKRKKSRFENVVKMVHVGDPKLGDVDGFIIEAIEKAMLPMKGLAKQASIKSYGRRYVDMTNKTVTEGDDHWREHCYDDHFV